MGMDIDFLAASKCKAQIEGLKDYIDELYDRDYSEDYDHRMLGYENTIEQVGELTVLKGCFRKCFGFVLSYWCKKEGKEPLLADVLFFENRQDEGAIRMTSGGYDQTFGMLYGYYEVFDRWAYEPIKVDDVVPAELHETLVSYF